MQHMQTIRVCAWNHNSQKLFVFMQQLCGLVLQDIMWKVKACLLQSIIDCIYTHDAFSQECKLQPQSLWRLRVAWHVDFFFLRAIGSHIWSWEHPAFINCTGATWRQQYLLISAEIRISLTESEAHTFIPHSRPCYLSGNSIASAKMLTKATIKILSLKKIRVVSCKRNPRKKEFYVERWL